LKEQAENSAAPTYAPGGLVTGKITIQGSESVTEVVLKVILSNEPEYEFSLTLYVFS
jgi:hypothetical protein